MTAPSTSRWRQRGRFCARQSAIILRVPAVALMRSRRPVLEPTLFLCFIVTATSCSSPSRDHARDSTWLADSSRYATRVSRWVHDSIVIDSLSRKVPTDSLYHLYRSMLVAPGPRPFLVSILCLQGNLDWEYGDLPGDLAIGRMKDTLWKPGEEKAYKAMESRLPPSDFITVSGKICGWAGIPKSPDTVDGTPLDEGHNPDALGPRPKPPRHR
jgi:hypothetical protein